MSARRAGVALAAVMLCAGAASANEDGRQSSRTMRGCGATGNCHGVNGGATVRIEGPGRLAPGARGTYTLVITSTRADFVNGGFDIGAAGATVAPNGAGTQMRGTELTHTAPVPKTGSEVRVAFDVVAPAAAGTAMIFAAGNASDGRRNDTNDAWAVTATAIAIAEATADAGAPTDAGSTPTDAGSTPTDAGSVRADAGPAFEAYDPLASSAYGHCAVAPGRARGGALALAVALTALLARRRRAP